MSIEDLLRDMVETEKRLQHQVWLLREAVILDADLVATLVGFLAEEIESILKRVDPPRAKAFRDEFMALTAEVTQRSKRRMDD